MRSVVTLNAGGLLVASSLALVGCPSDDGSGETGGVATALTTEATGTASTASTAGNTTDGSGTAGPVAVCEFGDQTWSFIDTPDMPDMRGLGTDDLTCNPVTADTTTIDVQIVLPEGIALDPSGVVRVLVFESDPNIADATADCVEGLCESLDGSDLRWSFEVPNDQPMLTYYIVVDIDADGPEIDGCSLRETDFVSFAPAQGTLMVPMTADGCG